MPPEGQQCRQHQTQQQGFFIICPFEQREKTAGPEENRRKDVSGINPSLQSPCQEQQADPDQTTEEMRNFDHWQGKNCVESVEAAGYRRSGPGKQQNRATEQRGGRQQMRYQDSPPAIHLDDGFFDLGFFLEDLIASHNECCQGQGQQIVHTAIDQHRAEKGICRDLRCGQQDHRLEDPQPTRDMADQGDNLGQKVDLKKLNKRECGRLGQQDEEYASSQDPVERSDQQLSPGQTWRRDREFPVAIAEWLFPQGNDDQIQ